MNKSRYTPAEDKIVVNSIKANPHNLNDGFQVAAKAIKRSPKSVAGRYYTCLRNKVPMLATGNDKILLVNTKNTVSTIYSSYFNSVMRDKLMREVFSTLPQNVLVDFFMDNVSREVKDDLTKKIFKQLKH